MSTIVPSPSPIYLDAWTRTGGVASGQAVRGAQWRALERCAQHYMLCRHAQPGAWGRDVGVDAEDSEEYRGIHLLWTEPMCWSSSYLWFVFDGYRQPSGPVERITATLYLDGVDVGSKSWNQGYSTTLVDFTLDGTNALLAGPLEHHAHLVARDDTGSLRTGGYINARTYGIIHNPSGSYTTP
jgi:hypothetical protein